MDTVREGTCGACKYFEFKGNNEKGYCSWIGAYYWDNDRICSHYVLDDDMSPASGGGCFLPTACCQYQGLPDDCRELTELRAFRDGWLAETEEGRALTAEYYAMAPGIVEKIQASPRREAILEGIYGEIGRVLVLIRRGEDQAAVEAYRAMVLRVQEETKEVRA